MKIDLLAAGMFTGSKLLLDLKASLSSILATGGHVATTACLQVTSKALFVPESLARIRIEPFSSTVSEETLLIK